MPTRICAFQWMSIEAQKEWKLMEYFVSDNKMSRLMFWGLFSGKTCHSIQTSALQVASWRHCLNQRRVLEDYELSLKGGR